MDYGLNNQVCKQVANSWQIIIKSKIWLQSKMLF